MLPNREKRGWMPIKNRCVQAAVFVMTGSTEEQMTRSATPDRPAMIGPSVRPLTPTEFNTAMVHLYRGEVGRANTWRMRLDGTTNWAVLTTGATLSFAFS